MRRGHEDRHRTQPHARVTINPDFGQVEADPAEVNLTAFETRFTERRPFFLEGAQLFNIGHPNFYYSRRIGARPIGPATGDFVDYPPSATILGAAKLTGRLPSKTSLGFLAAATARGPREVANAELGDRRAPSGSRRARTTAWPRPAGVRAARPRRPASSPTACIATSTTATRWPTSTRATRSALAGNTLLRFKGGEYQFRAAGGGSLVTGTRRR